MGTSEPPPYPIFSPASSPSRTKPAAIEASSRSLEYCGYCGHCGHSAGRRAANGSAPSTPVAIPDGRKPGHRAHARILQVWRPAQRGWSRSGRRAPSGPWAAISATRAQDRQQVRGGDGAVFEASGLRVAPSISRPRRPAAKPSSNGCRGSGAVTSRSDRSSAGSRQGTSYACARQRCCRWCRGAPAHATSPAGPNTEQRHSHGGERRCWHI